MTIERTSYLSGVTSLVGLQIEDAVMAHRVAAYARPGREGTATVVVEVLDRRGNLLARDVLDTDAQRETAADHMLVDSRLERSGAWRVDPIHKHRRLVAEVTLRLSDSVSDFEQQRLSALSA